jgi:putative ABC transport system substrate-binding protein
MFKKIFVPIVILLVLFGAYKIKSQNENKIIIGIIQPIEHQALDDIVAGFKTTFEENYHGKYEIKVENAQNDFSLQRAILEKMRDAHYNLIVPIGLGPTEMALSIIKNKPIIGLAASLSQGDREKLNPCHISIVHDEVPLEKIFKVIHATYPKLNEITLIHSDAEKVFPEVPRVIEAAKKVGIKVTDKMVSSLLDLMNLTQSLPKTTKSLFILKDHLIVSGIATLNDFATKNKIPLITSDEGSVEAGASFALGVYEKDIGKAGARQAIEILNGKEACQLPITEMNTPVIFVNKSSFTNKNLDLTQIINTSKVLNYPLVYVPTSN